MAFRQTLIQPFPYRIASRPFMMEGGQEHNYFKEAATQTWIIGDLIYVNTSGVMAIATDTTGVVDSELAGQATVAASGTTNEAVHFRLILPGDVYAMNVFHSTVATAITAQTMLTDIFGLFTTGTPNAFHVDMENTTTEDATTASAYVRVVGFPDRNPATGDPSTIGDEYGIVLVSFLDNTVATDGAPSRRNLQFGN